MDNYTHWICICQAHFGKNLSDALIESSIRGNMVTLITRNPTNLERIKYHDYIETEDKKN